MSSGEKLWAHARNTIITKWLYLLPFVGTLAGLGSLGCSRFNWNCFWVRRQVSRSGLCLFTCHLARLTASDATGNDAARHAKDAKAESDESKEIH